nr:hypothetical protein [Tanacetum cinerariifolium]
QRIEITDLRATDRRFQTTVGTQQEEIRDLRAAHRKLQAQFIRALTALKTCQTQLTAALGRIQILEVVRVPAQPEGVAKALAARDVNRNTNDDDNHVSGTRARRTERVTHECNYPDFMKCKPLNFKGIEGVVELTQWAYTMGSGEKKPYGGSKPLFPKCNYHHDGPCALKFYKCNKVGYIARDCKGTANERWYKVKNNNRGTQGGNATTPAKVYAVGRTGTNPDSNVVTGTLLLNNRCASILFYTGADRSFVSIAFSSQIAITSTTLDHHYDVELADGRIIRLNSILRGCTLNFLNHPLNIDLMPVELGSFNAIIGMDWLAKYHAVIVCAEKIVRIPWEMKS